MTTTTSSSTRVPLKSVEMALTTVATDKSMKVVAVISRALASRAPLVPVTFATTTVIVEVLDLASEGTPLA